MYLIYLEAEVTVAVKTKPGMVTAVGASITNDFHEYFEKIHPDRCSIILKTEANGATNIISFSSWNSNMEIELFVAKFKGLVDHGLIIHSASV